MIQIIEQSGLVVTNFEEKWKKEGKISVGYLSAAAKNNRNIGIRLIEHFLEEFPYTDVNWLITGKHVSGNTEKNITNDGKPALSKDEELLQVYRDHYIQSKALISELQEKIQGLEKRLGEDKKNKARPAHN